MTLSEIGEKIEKAVFWIGKEVGWIRNKCTHTFLSYEKTKTIAVLAHYEDEETLAEAEEIANLLKKDGRGFLLSSIEKREGKNAPPHHRGRRLPVEKKNEDVRPTDRPLKERDNKNETHVVRHRGKGKVGIKREDPRDIHNVCLTTKANTPDTLRQIIEYLKKLG